MELPNDIAVVLAHSLDVDVDLSFAWKFRTDIAKWADPPATFQLDGPFATGLAARTGALVWWIREVQTERSFAIEMALDRATFRYEWHFSAISKRRTRMTQRIILSGSNAKTYTQQVKAGFGATLADGMKRIAVDMVTAESRANGRLTSKWSRRRRVARAPLTGRDSFGPLDC